MKSMLAGFVIALALSSPLAAQDSAVPAMRAGVAVQLPVSSQAVAMPDADKEGATVVTVTADGGFYVGTQPTDATEIARLHAGTIYVKADAQAPYQQVLTVVSALSGRRVVLLTGVTGKAAPGAITPPYGISLSVASQ